MQYHVGTIVTTSAPPRRPVIVVRCPAIQPAASSPARIVVSRATRHLAVARPFVDGDGGGVGQRGEGGLELAEEVRRPPSVEGGHGPAKAHEVKEQLRRVAP